MTPIQLWTTSFRLSHPPCADRWAEEDSLISGSRRTHILWLGNWLDTPLRPLTLTSCPMAQDASKLTCGHLPKDRSSLTDTFSKSVPFLDVCEAIGNSTTADDWPIFVSLECHVGVEGQPEMVDLMDRTWGAKLVREILNGTTPEEVSPLKLKGKILLMV